MANSKEEALKIHDEVTQVKGTTGSHNVYTDESGFNGKIGAAAVGRFRGHPIKKRRHMGSIQISTVYVAELKGIDLALAWGLDGT